MNQPELLFHEIRQIRGPLVAYFSVFHFPTEQGGASFKIHPVAQIQLMVHCLFLKDYQLY